MNWYEEESAQRAKVSEDQETIKAQSSLIYEDLWKAILEVVNFPQVQSVHKPKPNGRPEHHEVTAFVGTKFEKLNLDLGEAHQTISATSTNGVSILLELQIDPRNNEVCLWIEGKKVDYKTAAQRVMQPFLLP